MDIIISNSNGKPIYEQISSQVRAQILSGALKAGERLPSIRVLALGYGLLQPETVYARDLNAGR